MTFKDFINNGQVRRTTCDRGLITSLVETAIADLKFLKNVEINEFSARKTMVNFYDTLRSVIEAIAIIDGYKVYSHEAFTFFLKEKGESVIAEKFDRFRRIRNGINYYGKDISTAEVKEYTKEILKLVQILKEKYIDKELNK